MGHDLEALAAIKEWFPPADVSQTLSHVLRVPEAWEALGDADFRYRLSSQRLAPPLTPWKLGNAQLGISDVVARNPSDLPADLAERMQVLWSRIDADGEADLGLEGVQLLALALAWELNARSDPAWLVKRFQTHPNRWRSVLACAWPAIHDHAALIQQIAAWDDPAGLLLMANSMLANDDLARAAEAWPQFTPVMQARALGTLSEMGERALASALSARQPEAPQPPEARSLFEDPELLLLISAKQTALGDLDAAQFTLDQASLQAGQLQQFMAEQAASLARKRADPDLARSAVRTLITDATSPWMRAKLALTLIRTGDLAGAETIVPAGGKSLPDDLARGALHLARDSRQAARAILVGLMPSREAIVLRGELWINTLLELALSLAEPASILRLTETRARTWGHSPEVRLDLAQKLLAWGDPESGSVHARLAASLAPDSVESRRCLAEALVGLGRRMEALHVWASVGVQDASLLAPYIECALSSGDFTHAEQAFQRMDGTKAPPLERQILRAKFAAAQGDLEAAEKQLRQITEVAPAAPEAWISLAGLYQGAGRYEDALETLSAAAQAAPESGAVLMAYAELLEERGRLSEALAACEAAGELEPRRVDCMQLQGALSLKLGHTRRAIDALEHALEVQPLSRDIRRLLALALEEAGEAGAAWELISPIRDRMTSGDSLLVGRLAARAAASGDMDALQTAFSALADAGNAAPNDLDVEYWLGRAHLAAGEWGQARERFERCLVSDAGHNGDRLRRASIGFSEATLNDGDPAQALSTLESAFEHGVGDVRFLTLLSKVHNALEDAEAGLASAELALELDPLDPDAFQQMRRAAQLAGNSSRAIGFVQGLISNRPGEPDLWLELAEIGIDCQDERLTREALAHALYAGRGNPDSLVRGARLLREIGQGPFASRALRRAVHLHPGDTSLLEKWAALSESLEDWENALAAWSKLADLTPAQLGPSLGAAQALWRGGRREEAIQRLQEAIAAFPTEPAAYLALAHSLLEDGRELTALDLYRRAHDRFPGHAEIAREAGIVTLEHGAPEAALEILKKAIRAQPNHLQLLIALADCCARLQKYDQSIRILRKVNARDDSPALAASMFASVALQACDDQAVEEASRYCLSAAPASDEEYKLLSRARADLGQWEPAFRTAQEWHAGSHSRESASTLLQLRLRLADAYWLFTHFCKAAHHGPDWRWVSADRRDEAEMLISEAREIGVDEALLEVCQTRLEFCFENPSPEGLTPAEERIKPSANPGACEGLALAYLRADMPVKAIQFLGDEAVAVLSLAWAPLILGTAFRLQEEPDLAGFHLEEAGGHPDLRPYADYQFAMCMFESGSPQGAIERLNLALSHCPKEPAWHYQLGRLYRAGDQLDVALPHFQGAKDFEPGNNEYALALARAFRDLGQPAAALEVYNELLARSGEESDLWSEVGQVSLDSGDFHRAGEFFRRATALSPQDPLALIGYAQAAAARGEAKLARDLAQKALRAAPHDASVLLGLAKILQSEGRVRDSLEIYDKAARLSGDPLKVKLDRCDVLIGARKFEQAERDLQMLAGEHPENDRIWASLAKSLEASGKFNLALEAVSRAIRIAPRNTNYRLLLGRLCRKSGQLDRALHEMARVRDLDAHDFRLPIELGRVYEARRDYARALECYREAISHNPHDAGAFYRAGLVLKSLKDYPHAAQMLKRTVEIDPKNTEAHHQLAAVRALELVHCTIMEAVG